MVRPKNKTENLLVSIAENCETLIKQTHTDPQKTIENKLTKPRETFSFKRTIPIEGCWMTRITNLDVCNSIFIITEEKKFKLFRDTLDEFSLTELKDELEEILVVSNISHERLQDKIIGPHIIKAIKKLETENGRTDGFYMFLMGYARSAFRDFATYLRIVVGLNGEDIQLILKQ